MPNTTVYFAIGNSSGNPLSGSTNSYVTSNYVTLAPTSYPLNNNNQILDGDVQTFTPDINGTFTASLYPQIYKGFVKSQNTHTQFYLNVITSSVPINAANYLIVPSSSVVNLGKYAYSMATSDGRYIQIGTPISASYFSGSISNAVSSSYSTTASYALNGGGSGTSIVTGSTLPITASVAITASYYNGIISTASYANTSSYLVGYSIPVLVTSSISSSYSTTASYANNSLTASYANTSSYLVGYSIPVLVTSSISSSYSTTSSYANNSLTASYANTSSYLVGYSIPVLVTSSISSSYSTTSSYANNSLTASYANTSSYLVGYSIPTTVTSSISASYAATLLDANINNANWSTQIGINAGTNSTTSSQNVQVGYLTGQNSTNAGYAVQIGSQAGQNTVIGNNAVQVGYAAGLSSTTASAAVQVGSSAGQNATNAGFAVQIGYTAGQYSTTATNAVQVGPYTGQNSTNANQTVQIGAYAGFNSPTASNAVQIGAYSGINSTNANQAVQIGAGSGNSSTTASNATQVGYQAGFYSTNATNATHIGYQAGYNSATGSNATMLGSNADALNATSNVQNSIAIGYMAKVNAPNTCVIGGTGANAVKVAIGNTTAVNTLDVVGNISCSVITASLHLGTASYAITALSASYFSGSISNCITAQTASYYSGSISSALTATSASYSLTSSYALNGGNGSGTTITTGSTYPITASVALNVNTASYATNANNAYSLINPSNVQITAQGNNSVTVQGNNVVLNTTAALQLSTNQYANNVYLTASGMGINVIAPVNALDVNGNISCSVITASLFKGTASVATNANSGSVTATTANQIYNFDLSTGVGNQPTFISTNLQFNPSTNVLSGGAGGLYIQATNLTSSYGFQGTASYATTASYALNGGSSSGSSTVTYSTLVPDANKYVTMSLASTENIFNLTSSALYNFTCSNLPTGNTVYAASCFINNTANATSSLSFPSNWTFIGSVPTNITSSKNAVLSLKAYGTASIIAGFAVQY